MVTAGEYRIAKIVAVWRDNEGALYALPPCGRCREFMRQVDPANLDADVILDRKRRAGHRQLRHCPSSLLHEQIDGGRSPRAAAAAWGSSRRPASPSAARWCAAYRRGQIGVTADLWRACAIWHG